MKRPLLFTLEPGARLPDRTYLGDAGFDLYCYEDCVIPVNGFADVSCGCAVELPEGVWAMITGRSSTIRRHRLLVTTGIIDTGYRGPLYTAVQNLGTTPFKVETGMRLAQLIPFANLAGKLVPTHVNKLEPSDRGVMGFGSTGC